MGILAVRNAILSTIATGIPEFLDVRFHGGDGGLVDLKRVSLRLPFALLSISSAKGLEYQGGLATAVDFCLEIFAKNQPEVSRWDLIVSLTQKVFKLLWNQDWGSPDIKSRPENIDGKSMYAPNIDETGAAKWKITWSQDVLLSPEIPGEYGQLLEIGMDYNTQNPPDEIPEAHDEIVPL